MGLRCIFDLFEMIGCDQLYYYLSAWSRQGKKHEICPNMPKRMKIKLTINFMIIMTSPLLNSGMTSLFEKVSYHPTILMILSTSAANIRSSIYKFRRKDPNSLSSMIADLNTSTNMLEKWLLLKSKSLKISQVRSM